MPFLPVHTTHKREKPTNVVFLTTAGTLAFTNGITTTLGTVPTKILSAISCGAVFMGANTYIGNAPNFMVKAISDENGVKMPSFFGYMLWSVLLSKFDSVSLKILEYLLHYWCDILILKCPVLSSECD